jgi:YfiH family protein
MSQAPVLRADWPAPSNVRAFTTLRGDAASGASRAPFEYFNLGDRCGDAPDAVATNRQRLVERAGLPAVPRWLRQVHGTGVQRFELGESPVAGFAVEDGNPQALEADASVTSTPGLVLAILTADCLPVLFCARDGGEIGAAHAGWRGLAAGVLEQTVAAMRTPAEELLAWLGPAAGPAAYEVGAEVREVFLSLDPHATMAFVPTRPGHWHVDLYALARRRLQGCGVSRISGGGLCTISDPARFYSHRRDGRTGRMASVIWIHATD